MRRIIFYKTKSGNNPVKEFLAGLAPKPSAKVVWTLNLIETRRVVDSKYLKKLKGTTGHRASRTAQGRLPQEEKP